MGKITIVGAGNAGCTYAAYAGMAGHDVCLYESPEFADNLTDIAARGGLEVTGCKEGFGRVAKTTTDIKEALEYADYILVVMPAFGHKIMAKLFAPYLKSGQTVVLNPGDVFGAVEFLSTLRQCGNHEDVTIGETASSIFACRRHRPADVVILGIKEGMQLGCIPASRTEKVVEDLKAFFPQYIGVPNVLHSSCLDINAFVHPICALLNSARIENTKGNFDFYWDGMTEGVCANMEAIDNEKLAIGRAMGYELVPLLEQCHRYYGYEECKTLHVYFTTNTVNGGSPSSKAPSTFKHRYVTEDVPYGLVPLSDLAKVAGVPTPHIDAVITLCSTFNGEDYRAIGRSFANLGLAGKSLDEIKDIVTNGF